MTNEIKTMWAMLEAGWQAECAVQSAFAAINPASWAWQFPIEAVERRLVGSTEELWIAGERLVTEMDCMIAGRALVKMMLRRGCHRTLGAGSRPASLHKIAAGSAR